MFIFKIKGIKDSARTYYHINRYQGNNNKSSHVTYQVT